MSSEASQSETAHAQTGHARGPWARYGAVSVERMHLWLMLALTFSTGIVDAVGYLGLDRVFTGNMTGNVVILAMGLVGSESLPVLGPLLALVGFMAGAALGGRMLRRATGAWTGRTTILFTLVALVVLGLGVALLVLGDGGESSGVSSGVSHGWQVTTTTLLGAVMGVQAATARFIAVKDVTTVVVTSTITGLAADSFLGSGKGRVGGSGRRALAVLLMLVGAGVGALLLRWQLGAGLVLAGVVVALVSLAGALHQRARRNV